MLDIGYCFFSAHDNNGTPIDNITIQCASNLLTTGIRGNAPIIEMEPGTYNYTATKKGFKDSRGCITVYHSSATIIDIKLDQEIKINANSFANISVVQASSKMDIIY